MPTFYSKKSAPKTTFHQRTEHSEDPLKTLLTWRAPARPYRKKDRSFYTTTATIVILVCLILLLTREFLAIGAILAFMFVVYVLNFVPPEDVDYKITTQGVTIHEHFYPWDDLEFFWFTEKENHKILNIFTNLRFPNVLIIPMGSQSEDQLRKIVSGYLIYLEHAPKSVIDNWAEKLQKHFPLENPHK